MWNYFGSKGNVISYYPPPKYDKIIEPFAGTARYALKYFDREVVLVDKYEVIINIWKWLQKCSPEDIRKLPRLKYKEKLDDFNFDCEEAKNLVGFTIGFASRSPRKTGTIRLQERPNCANYTLTNIEKNLFKIKHWKIIHGSYEFIKNQEATWFIDPPYFKGGESYVHSNKNINYSDLERYCKNRKGQVIVCETPPANWLPFKKMTRQKTLNGFQNELIWSNMPTNFDNEQQKLF